MAGTNPLLVSIVDESGAAFAVDKVTWTLGSTPVVKTAAPFSFDLAAEGSGTLIVEKQGHHTYTFTLDVKQKGGEFTAGWSTSSMIDRPRMASLAKVKATGPTPGPASNALTVKIGAVQEVVLLLGYDYHSGSNFRALGTQRMHDIATTLTDSTVVTVFELQTGQIARWVRGAGKEKLGSAFAWAAGWSRMTLEQRTVPDLDKTKADYPGPGTMGIMEAHAYVQQVGHLRPGSLQEYSILSHSWNEGPILFDTDEHGDFVRGGSKEDVRDPVDRDGRFFKDFNSTNMPGVADFKAAFAPTALVKVWGCFAWRPYRDAVNAARKATSDTQALGVPADVRTSFFAPKPVFPDTRPGIIAWLRASPLKANYMFALSQATGLPVFGGAPGLGALFLPTAFGLRMYMPAKKLSIVGGKVVEGAVVFQPEIDFYRTVVGLSFDDGNYLRFQA